MDLSSVVLAIAQADGPTSVLGQVVGALLGQEGIALARVWFLDDRDCPVCRDAARDEPRGTLHLRASRTRAGESAPCARVDGVHHLVRLDGPSRIALVASSADPLPASLGDEPEAFGIEADFVRRESLSGFIGYPLRFRGAIVGVLACYLHGCIGDPMPAWLPTFAAHASVAIGNCRAFQEIRQLQRELELERDYLREQIDPIDAFDEMAGTSDGLQRLRRQVAMVAPTEANVLIEGESGTGKELVARAIHRRSPKAGRALVKVNCGSVPKDLFESEFFGHVRGAFTGAIRDRIGRFQLADRGMLFLDEVGEIPLDLQPKLLRVLQDGEFERVGDDTTRHVSVRVLAATNRDLRAEVDAGRFRLDLFYRLSVFPIHVPPLRERREDIPHLAALFVRLASERLHRPSPRIPRAEIDTLVEYNWPGNIRELQHVVERAVILAAGRPLHFDVGPAQAPAAISPAAGREYHTEKEWRRLERENLVAALKASGGKVSGRDGAAARLGVNASTLASRLRALGLRKRY